MKKKKIKKNKVSYDASKQCFSLSRFGFDTPDEIIDEAEEEDG